MPARRTGTQQSIQIEWDKWTYQVTGDTLRMLLGEQAFVTLKLTPVVNGKSLALGAWRKAAEDHYRAGVRGVGSAHIGIRHKRVAYWIETKRKQFETFTYFPEITFEGDHWQTFVSDSWDRRWHKDKDQDVGISSAYMKAGVFGHDGAGLTDPGDNPVTWVWNTPPRAFSVSAGLFPPAEHVGFSIPGALPVGVTHLSMKDRRLSLTFDMLRPGCRGASMPVVYLLPGLEDAYDVLDEHRAISEKLGLTKKKSGDHPAWWTKPVFKVFLEHWRLMQQTSDPEEQKKLLSTENLLDWTFTVKESIQADEMLAIFEQGVYRLYGDYHPIDSLGGVKGFRKTVDDLRKKGVRICYYIHPFMMNTKVDFYRKHPEAFCKPKDKSVKQTYAHEPHDDKPDYALVDWTHPKGRAYMLSQVELILSKKKGCLNCDWLRSNHWRSPDPRHFDFHDPDWGIGDLMTKRVQQLLYEKAKKVKPDCCVSKIAFAEPYMQPYADVDLLCEEWNGWTDTWYRRGRIATRLIGDTIFMTDPYFLTITKSYEYYMAMLAWISCEVPDVRHAVHPYCYFRELRPKDFKRRLAGIKVQENAPVRITDRISVEPPFAEGEEPEITRRRTEGKLAGCCAAMALSKRTFVTFSETEARIATSETRMVDVCLPPGAQVQAVEMVPHKGKARKWSHEVIGDPDTTWVSMKVEDCAGRALYYRVRYRLT